MSRREREERTTKDTIMYGFPYLNDEEIDKNEQLGRKTDYECTTIPF